MKKTNLLFKRAMLALCLLAVCWLPAKADVMLGDVDDNGTVEISDVTWLIEYLLTDDATIINLEKADVNQDGQVDIGDVSELIEIILALTSHPHPSSDYVDLGLPSGTLWATCNVGANAPEEYGDYFAWGETEPMDYYDWSTYKWCNGSYTTMTKYCTNSDYGYNGFVDYKTELDPVDDAAYVNRGPLWRMPTKEQILELKDNCTWLWTTQNGVNGYLVTGPNRNALFLPAAGWRWGESLQGVGSDGSYWSRTLGSGYPDYANGLYFSSYSGNVNWGDYYRYFGFTVRAVRVSPDDEQVLYIQPHSLDLGEVSIGEIRTDEVTIVNNTNEAATVTVNADEPFLLKQGANSASSMTVVVPSHSNATVTVMFTAETPGDFNGNVTFQNPAFDGGQSVVTVHASAISVIEPHEYVDLGLPSGTLWATCNVGADNPEEYGDYFAWGETAPKNEYYIDTYIWFGWYNEEHVEDEGPWAWEGSMTKYCTDEYYGVYGFVDYKTELDPEDDAAYVNWGPSWRMPTQEQCQELIDNCTWTWTTQNGMNGYLVTGSNGKTLFFPAAGYCYDANSLDYYGSRGYYWSRTLDLDIQVFAQLLYFSDNVGSRGRDRYYGSSVRAVRVSQN